MDENQILVIDPFQSILNAYRMILEKEKYLVETLKNFDEAYHHLSTKKYAAIITEYLHPSEEMGRLIQRVKQNSPETYILMVTSLLIDEAIYEKLFDLGLNDLVMKPYAPGKILAHIRQGLRQRGLILRKQELEKQSLLDPIGQRIQQLIFNSTYFKKCLRQEIKRARRHHHPVSLLLIQIPSVEKRVDQFEDFCNELGTLLRKSVREEDMLGKNNGTFGIILPETDPIGSQILVQRLSNLIQIHPAFQSDESMSPLVQKVSFETYTFPGEFNVPDFLKSVLE